jgi:MFS family permease
MILFKKGELKLLWPFYLSMFIGGITGAIAFPVLVIYFQNLGFSFTQIGLIMAIPMIATLIFEIPTGAIADLYGRKFSVMLSFILGGVLTFIVPFFKELSILIVIFFLYAISQTLSSGADEAWVVDLLKYKKRSDLVQNYYSKILMLTGAGMVIGGILSGVTIVLIGIKGVWYVAGIGAFLTAIILQIFTKEHFVKRKIKIKKALRDTFKKSKEGFIYVIKHPVLFYFLLEIIIFSFAEIFALAWQPYFNKLGLGIENFGILFSVVGLIAIFAPMASMSILKILKSEKNALIVTSLVNGVLMILLANATSLIPALILFILVYPLSVAVSPIASKFQQQFIPSKQRATINSLFSAIAVPGAIVSYLIGGILLDKFGIKIGLLVVALVSFVSIVLYLLMRPEKAKIHI